MPAQSKQHSDGNENDSGSTFAARYPHIDAWVKDGWVEIGRDDYSRSMVRALDIGGLVWEGEPSYSTLDEALQALDAGIKTWLEENG